MSKGPRLADEAYAHPELAARAKHYSAMALKHADVSFAQRRAFDTTTLRHMNNYVKACFVDVCLRTIHSVTAERGFVIADIASGRGQDQAKFMYGCPPGTAVRAYYGLDLSAEDTISARLMAEKYLPTATVDIVQGDMGTFSGFAHIPTASVHLLTCQMAVHYLFHDPGALDTFLSEVGRVLCPRGLAVLSYTDGRAIVRRARTVCASWPPAPEEDIEVRGRYFSFRVPGKCVTADLASPFGNKYTITIPGSVDDVAEYLAHEPTLIARARAMGGLMPGVAAGFHQAVPMFMTRPRYQAIAAKMGGNGAEDPEAFDAASLYRVNVFSKSGTALQAWDTALNS